MTNHETDALKSCRKRSHRTSMIFRTKKVAESARIAHRPKEKSGLACPLPKATRKLASGFPWTASMNSQTSRHSHDDPWIAEARLAAKLNKWEDLKIKPLPSQRAGVVAIIQPRHWCSRHASFVPTFWNSRTRLSQTDQNAWLCPPWGPEFSQAIEATCQGVAFTLESP